MKKHSVKRFDDWVNESYVNEGIGDVFRGAKEKVKGAVQSAVKAIARIPGLQWVGDAFGGTGSWFINKVVASRENRKAYKGIKYIPSDDVDKVIKEYKPSATGETWSTFINKNRAPLKGLDNLTREEVEEIEMEMDMRYEGLSESRVNESGFSAEKLKGYDLWKSDDDNIEDVNWKELQEDIEIDVERFQDLLEIYEAGEEIPENQYPPILFIWGTFGIGKTAVLKKLRQTTTGGAYKGFNMCLMEPDSFGLPYLLDPVEGEEGRRAATAPTSALPLVSNDVKDPVKRAKLEAAVAPPDGGVGILFFDELGAVTDKRMLNSILKLIGERELEGHTLGRNWMVIVAGNRQKDRQDLVMTTIENMALMNRFSHVNLLPDVEMFLEYSKGQKWRSKTRGEIPYYDPIVLDFIEQAPDWIHTFDPENQTLAFATPRSWEKTMAAIRTYEERMIKKGLDPTVPLDVIQRRATRNIGLEAALELVKYFKIARAIDPKKMQLVYTKDWKKAPKLPPEDKERSKRFAFTAFVNNLMNGKTLTVEECQNWANYMVENTEDTADMMKNVKNFFNIHPYLKKGQGGGTEGSKKSLALLQIIFDKFPTIVDAVEWKTVVG